MNSMMKPFKRNRVVMLKTYGKQMRKVDAWFSPDTRKTAFSSSSSSDLSIGAEENCTVNPGRVRQRKQTTARPKRNAKKRALTSLKDSEEEEEDSIFSVGKENKSDATARKDTVSRKGKRHAATLRPKRNAKRAVLKQNTNENGSVDEKEEAIEGMEDVAACKENNGCVVKTRRKNTSRQSKESTNSSRLPQNSKQRAVSRMKLTSTSESNDVEVADCLEDFIASSGKENIVDARDQRTTVKSQSKPSTSSARLQRSAKQRALSSVKLTSTSESIDAEIAGETEEFITSYGKGNADDSRDRWARVSRSAASSFVRPVALGKFVTDRRKALDENMRVRKTRPVKGRSVSFLKDTLNSSEDFKKTPVPSSRFVAKMKRTRYKRKSLLGNTSSEMSSLFSNCKKKKCRVSERSFSSTADSMLKTRAYKQPLLASTPSASCQPCYKPYDPSFSEISFSNEEPEEVCKTNMEEGKDVLSPEGRELKFLVGRGSKNCTKGDSVKGMPSLEIMQHDVENHEVEYSRELFSQTNEASIVSHPNRTNKEMLITKTPETHISDQSSSVNDCLVFVSSPLIKVSQPVVLLKPVDIPKHLVNHNLQSNPEKPECYAASDKTQVLQEKHCRRLNMDSTMCRKLSAQQSDYKMADNTHSSDFTESRSGQNVSSETDDVKVLEERHSLDVTPQYVQNTVSLDGRDVVQLQKQNKTEERILNKTPKISPSILSITVDNSPLTVVSEKNKQPVRLSNACLKERCIVSQPVVVLQRSKLPIDIYKLRDMKQRRSLDSKQELSYSSHQIEKTVFTEHLNLPDTTQNHSIKNLVPNKETAVPTSPVADCIVPEFAQTKELEIGSRSRLNVDLTLCRKVSAQHPIGLLSSSKKKKTDAPEAAKTDSTSSDSSESRNNQAVSPAKKKVPGRVRTRGIPKEKPVTGRKACISGFSASRWTKNGKAQKEQRRKHFTYQLLATRNADNSLDDFSCRPLHNPKWSMGNMDSWLCDANDLMPPVTPLRKDCLQKSSFLLNFTPETFNTHNWSRLKASLSVHKKMKAILTPKKLNLSNPVSEKDLGTVTPFSNKSLRLLSGAEGSFLNTLNLSDISDAEKLYQECKQDGPLSFEECIPPHKMQSCKKIGEGAFGEVFCTTNNNNEFVALKIIPIEGEQTVNGEMQKKFDEILHEVIISKELSNLSEMEENKTEGFITLHDLHCAKGSYPKPLLKAWDKFDKQRNSENDRPDFFEEDQLFLILEFEFGGSDLENMQKKLPSLATAKSILHQVTASLAVAEQALCFEHRDLHWGNILVKKTNVKEGKYTINGTTYNVMTNGVHVNIIDYSLSRLEIDGLTVSCDISTDEGLFMGQGDYQFEIYRKMREENHNSWSEYNPHTNVLWLHYLTDKLLKMSYKTNPRSHALKETKKNIEQFYRELLQYESATQVLQSCSLFQ
ncbi:uncharacterized protein LOC117408725 [Acipenser ruthenus]|uniref:uncharacterized protein LOC117408725 n=1 Tax=Acipenser ruthenus TaxID=7906 RepID=UPI0027404842|nr:uncharacterized protein LOC117408725 [Acipenser ruthenus]XP_058861921.1 uncharacterized protein LOC117408725 [Acipenser ruthenus]